MKIGVLSQYFKGIAAKRLVKGEVSPKVSNQHEFNGVNSLGLLLGYHAEKSKRFPAKFIYLNDNLENPVEFDSTVTWYDTRRNQPHRAPEYRLYYQTSSVMDYAAYNDLLIVAKTQTDELLIIIAAAGSTFDNQLRYLFGLDLRGSGYEIFEEEKIEKIQLGYTQKIILSSIGIEIEETDENILEIMLDKFSGSFPTTKIFSEFARSTIIDLDPLIDPDLTIISWMEKEEILFKTLERYFISEKLKDRFGNENNLVDEFLKYSLSIHNRRKSRVGFALENHLEEIFRLFSIKYARTVITENKSKPDFLFPGVNEYHSSVFPVNLLISSLMNKSSSNSIECSKTLLA